MNSIDEKEYMKSMKKITDDNRKIYINILKESITKAEKMEYYNELEDITTDMIEKLREECLFSLVNGEKYSVIELIKDIIKYDEEFKDYPIDRDRMSWIIREFHDTFYDFDGFEDGVKKAMVEVKKYYEKSKY